MQKNLDPTSWFSHRELPFAPVHFVVTKTPITLESKLWILDKLRGRFSIVATPVPLDFTQPLIILNTSSEVPAFEDPKEASLYELTWS